MTLDEVLHRTVGRWQPSPLWILRGKMFTWPEKLLIIALLDLWHSTGRVAWWYASNAKLMNVADMSKPTFLKTRRRLVQKLILNYKSGTRNHVASRYHLSQEFLYALTQDKTTSSLKDKNYSSGNVATQPMNRLGNDVT